MKTNKELKEEIKYHKSKIEELKMQINQNNAKGKVGCYYYDGFGDSGNFNIISGFNKNNYQIISISRFGSSDTYNRVCLKEVYFEDYNYFFGDRKSHKVDSDFIDNFEKSCNSMLSRVQDEIKVKLMNQEGLTKNQVKFIGRFYKILADDSYILIYNYLDKTKKAEGFKFNKKGEFFARACKKKVTFLDDEESVEISESEFLNQFNQAVSMLKEKLSKSK